MSIIRQARRGFYLDELAIGDTFDCGGITVTEEAVIRFAMEWDLQPFHVDREAAQASLFNGLAGSGLQSVMLCYRLYFQAGLLEGTALAGLGIDEIRFHSPLRPCATLRVTAQVDKLRTTSKPDRGVLTWRIAGSMDGQDVVSMKLTALVARDPATMDGGAHLPVRQG